MEFHSQASNVAGVIGFKGFVLDQMMPDMGAVGLDHAGKIVFVERAVHDKSFQ